MEVTLPELVDLTRRNWVAVKRDVPRVAEMLYISETIGAGNGNSKIWNEVDTQTYADAKSEGANATKAKGGIGYNVTMVARTFAKQIDITLEMRNDGRYNEVKAYLTDLTRFCSNRADLDLTHRLTFGTATSYTDMNGQTVSTTVGDGLALFSSVHTLAFSSTTYSNLVTGNPVFSQGAFEAAKVLSTTNILSNFGEKRVMDFNTIISGDDASTVRAIKQMLNSTADVDAAQAGITNVYANAMKHVILPQLATTAVGAYDSTKRRWWGIASITGGADGWQAYYGTWIAPEMKDPMSGGNGEDINNLNWTFLTYCRYGIATVSPRGIIFSTPTS